MALLKSFFGAQVKIQNIDISTATNQTAEIPMTTEVHPDTAAFVVDRTRNVMQLVDAAGNLVQWTPGSVAPFYVTASPAINEVRLMGVDADGEPVFRLIDTAGTLVQWTENQSQTAYALGGEPFAVSTGNLAGQTVSTPPSVEAATTPPTATNSQFFDPTHRSIGWDAQGKEHFIQVDEVGRIVTYASDGSGLAYAGNATKSAAAIAADMLAANPYKTNPLTGQTTTPPIQNLGGGSTTTAATNSQFFDPTHRSIGWDAQGKEHFIQVDEAGKIVTYASDGTGLAYAGTATKSATLIAADMLAANPYKTNPHTGQTTTPPIQNGTGGTTVTTQKSSTAVILIALGAAALWLFNNQHA